MTRSRATFPLFILALQLPAQSPHLGAVRLYAVTEIGTPIAHAKVRIEGQATTRTLDINGPMSIELPYGVYTVTCSYPTLAAALRIVRVEKPGPIDVILGLPLADPAQVIGEGSFSPFEVSGQIRGAPAGAFGRVKVVGIFTEDVGDSTVDANGHFRLLLRNEGVYRLFVLYGKDILHEETLDLTFAIPRRKVSLDIQIAKKRE